MKLSTHVVTGDGVFTRAWRVFAPLNTIFNLPASFLEPSPLGLRPSTLTLLYYLPVNNEKEHHMAKQIFVLCPHHCSAGLICFF